MRLETQCIRDHLLGDRAFEIHTGLQHVAQHVHISILDMASVLAQMQGDRVSTCLFTDQRGTHHIGITRTPCLTQGGNVVNIQS